MTVSLNMQECSTTLYQASNINNQPVAAAWGVSCSLSTSAGYDQAVKVTVAQDNNPNYEATFTVVLPSGGGGGGSSSSSKTTAIVLGVIGGLVLVGIIGGVAWYVIKGRNNGDVDPYDDDATTGLNAGEHA